MLYINIKTCIEYVVLQAPQVLALMRAAVVEGDCAAALLYLAGYTFMLRIASEGFPITVGANPLAPLPDGQHSCLLCVVMK